MQEISKEEYFRAAADYYKITADIVSMLENGEMTPEKKKQIDSLELKKSYLSATMRDYSGATYIIGSPETRDLLQYPRLSKDNAKRELFVKARISNIKTLTKQKAVELSACGLLSPLLVRSIENYECGFWYTFLFSFIFVPGICVATYLLGSLATFLLINKASSVESKTLSEKESFIKNSRLFERLSLGASIIVGCLIGTCIALC